MKNRDNQILALRIAYIAGIFSLIICTVMLLNYWQLVTTDPLESEALKTLVESLHDDKGNEELKVEIRNLDLMSRSAYFTNQWQIRSGAYLLIGGIIILIIALRIYYSSKSEIIQPDAKDANLDLELLISRKWILYAVSLVFGLTLIAAFLSDDHLSESYLLIDSSGQNNQIPVQEIIPHQDLEIPSTSMPADEVIDAITEKEMVADTELRLEQLEQSGDEQMIENSSTGIPISAKIPDYNEIILHYPSFRGPFGLGIAHHKNTPTEWDGETGKNILWKTTVPLPGFSSPILWDNSIILTGADKTHESIFSFNALTGKLIWEHKVKIDRPAGTVNPTDDTGFAAPTATTDGRFVFAIFATGDLVCVDRYGNKMWSKNIGIPDNHYGHSSSLLVWRNLLFIQFDTNQNGKVLAFDVLSGDLVWETIRSSKISWASPILANLGDHQELILASSPDVAAYDPVSGKELWSFDCLSGEIGPSPAFHNGVVYAANEYASLIALKVGNPPSVLWESNEILPEVSSPVAFGNFLFVGASYGVIACYNALTGEILWEYESDNGFYASPIIADGKVYFLDRGGKMYIFSVAKTLKLINDPELGERTVSTPAFSEGRIYIRSLDHLYCIGS